MEALLEPLRSSDIQIQLGLNLLLAWAFYLTVVTGQLSLGHSAFMAIGAYAASIMTVKWDLPLAWALPFAALVAGISGVLVGFPALRLAGMYLAIATLGLVFLVELGIENWDYVGAKLGISGMTGSSVEMIWLLVLVVGIGMALLERSRLMLAFRAVRENENAAQAIGIDLTYVRVMGFATGAALAGLAGALWAHYIIFIDPQQFDILRSFEIVLYVVLGGVGTYWGPVLGATVMTILPVWVRPLQEWWEVAFALALIIMMGTRPQGLMTRKLAAKLMPWRWTHRTQRFVSATDEADNPRTTNASAIRLQVEGIGHSFGGVHALSNISFDVRHGEILGIIGPNGAGKTTLFNCIMGMIQPDEGSVRCEGHELVGMRADRIARLGIRRTFQQGAILKSFTVADNIRAGQHARTRVNWLNVLPFVGRAREAGLATEGQRVLARIGLDERPDDEAGALAYGDQRRLEIGRALAGEPMLLLLDEPAAGLNDTETAELGDLLRSLVDEGRTLILVEHHMGLVMRLCDRIVVLDGGLLIAEGTPAEISRNSAVIEAYLGTEAA